MAARPLVRTLIAGTTALTLLGTPVALAAPAEPTPVAPDTGPTAGGTVVTGTTADPVRFTGIEAGSLAHSAALGTDGHAYAWGTGTYLGTGGTVASPVPVPVTMPDGVTFTSISSGNGFTLAVGSDGHAYAWGNNASGQAGIGVVGGRVPVPERVHMPAGVTVTSVSAGPALAFAQGSDGRTYGWGQNTLGQVGMGSASASVPAPVPVLTPDGVTFTHLAAGMSFALAVGSDGLMYAWGSNRSGTFGDGQTSYATMAPVPIPMPDGVVFTALDADNGHAVAVGSDGNAYTWGDNTSGQLGHGTAGAGLNVLVPTPVAMPAGVSVTQIDAGNGTSVALGSDGMAYTWGNNSLGQLGNGTSGTGTNVSRPTPVTMPRGVSFTHVSADWNHVVALGSDGRAYAWGSNTSGQLGAGNAGGNSPVPVRVATDAVVSSVVFGDVPGSDLEQDDDGWTVTAPAHPCGIVDVTVHSHQLGRDRTMTLADGFAFGTAPSVTTHPTSRTLPAGVREVTLEATADGDDLPTVRWQRRTAGAGWADIRGADSTTLATSVEGTTEFRAVFTNCLGTATSGIATVTPTVAGGGGGGGAGGGEGEGGGAGGGDGQGVGAPDTTDVGSDRALAATGTQAALWALLAAALIAGGAVLVRRRSAAA